MKRLAIWLGLAGLGLTTFLIGLVCYFPAAAVIPRLSLFIPSHIQLDWQGIGGTLLDGRVQRLEIAIGNGWPIGVGPIGWHIESPGRLQLALGAPQTAWQLSVQPELGRLAWQVKGGSLAVLDARATPLALQHPLTGRFSGRLQFWTGGGKCLSSQGSLTSPALGMQLPDPVPLGEGLLQLSCDGADAPNWQLALKDGQQLDLALSNEGTQAVLVRGYLSPEHPLTPYWQLLGPDAGSGDIKVRMLP
ncbi:hypothetical protein HCU01_36380 [Halomonas cupida]|uniref:General secretion pathway protein N n=1 Tax=Halomonas cupida TaxID=44933 RepID=A0A1M7M8G5_9GAMM|nr:hypothetical protein [Halomonas cupida]GEN25689.1 hypothetical protein HCU01_36380 [Halomonas cupida]SHM86563.1 hypothetical protein SAMN05660971_04094 [Halomonas cupida]